VAKRKPYRDAAGRFAKRPEPKPRPKSTKKSHPRSWIARHKRQGLDAIRLAEIERELQHPPERAQAEREALAKEQAEIPTERPTTNETDQWKAWLALEESEMPADVHNALSVVLDNLDLSWVMTTCVIKIGDSGSPLVFDQGPEKSGRTRVEQLRQFFAALAEIMLREAALDQVYVNGVTPDGHVVSISSVNPEVNTYPTPGLSGTKRKILKKRAETPLETRKRQNREAQQRHRVKQRNADLQKPKTGKGKPRIRKR